MSAIRNHGNPRHDRIENTQYSARPSDAAKEYFGKGYFQPRFNTRPFRLTALNPDLLCDPKEFDWLEGFTIVCKYMSRMQEEWKKGMTVAEYWILHVGPE